MDWHIPLLVSAIAFAAFMIFKLRPAISPGSRASAALLKEAKVRIFAAKDDTGRSSALCDAADACARLGRTGAAVSFYLRAVKADPTSTEIVERATVSLAKRPAALEKIMWRKLAGGPWTGEGRASALAALRALAAAYNKRPRFFSARARALEHAVELFEQAAVAGRREG